MNNQKTITDLQSNKWRSWIVLFLRWLFGGLVGFWISEWISLGYLSQNVTGLLAVILDIIPIVSVLFIGQVLLFDPSFFGEKKFIDLLAYVFPNAEQNFLIVLVPSLIWGLIGLLLASGRKEQKKTGILLLVIYVIVGFVSLIRVFIQIPT